MNYQKLIVPAIVVAALIGLVLWSGCPGPGPTPVPPTPTPDPDPNPQPTPAPVVVAVYESKDRTAEQAAVLAGLQTFMDAEGIGWRYADKDRIGGVSEETPPWLVPYLALISKAGKPLPVLIVKNKVHPLPASVEAAVNLVKKGM